MFVCALLMLPFYQLCHRVRRHINGLKYRQRLPIPDTAVQDAALQGWSSALNAVRQSEHKYVVISVAFGLGNRLRALASAMAVAAAAQRKLLVVWPLDEHCNCSFRSLFAEPLPFALLEDAVPVGEAMDDPLFQAFSYMKSDDSSEKNARINIDMDRHLFVRSAFVLNHHRGGWEFARAQLRSLVPVKAVKSKLVADTSMLGLHVRAIFDAPRPASSGVTSQSALQIASREYGSNESAALLQWRLRGSWPNFVRRIRREPAEARFYLSADAEEAYAGLMKAFPGRIVRTPRPCAAERCDFRDAASIQMALVRCAPPTRRTQPRDSACDPMPSAPRCACAGRHAQPGAHAAHPRLLLQLLLRGGSLLWPSRLLRHAGAHRIRWRRLWRRVQSESHDLLGN